MTPTTPQRAPISGEARCAHANCGKVLSRHHKVHYNATPEPYHYCWSFNEAAPTLAAREQTFLDPIISEPEAARGEELPEGWTRVDPVPENWCKDSGVYRHESGAHVQEFPPRNGTKRKPFSVYWRAGSNTAGREDGERPTRNEAMAEALGKAPDYDTRCNGEHFSGTCPTCGQRCERDAIAQLRADLEAARARVGEVERERDDAKRAYDIVSGMVSALEEQLADKRVERWHATHNAALTGALASAHSYPIDIASEYADRAHGPLTSSAEGKERDNA